jgi:hypothetical protein
LTNAEFLLSRVRSLLDSLPKTPDKIAGFLQAEGIKGFRETASLCPIANYLRRELEYKAISIITTCVLIGNISGVVRLPEYVTDFVIKFDGDEYPFLVEN